MDTKSDWTEGGEHGKSLDKYPGTLGAFSPFSFLTRSPCWVTRVNGQEAESDEDEGGAGADVGGARVDVGGVSAAVGGAMPGL